MFTTNTTPILPCSCGNARDHKVARRTTADGTTIVLWSDGAITGVLGFKLPGVPMVRPRTEAAVALAMAAGWLLMGEVEIHDLSEVPNLYRACRLVAKRGGLPGDVRARLSEKAPAARPTEH